jgi:hypothetical protein
VSRVQTAEEEHEDAEVDTGGVAERDQIESSGSVRQLLIKEIDIGRVMERDQIESEGFR